MRGAVYRATGLLVATLGLTGCAGPGDSAAPAPAGAEKKAGAKTAAVELAEVRYPALETALREQKGTVVLVDFWATWCPPCVANFPHLVELHHKYADRGLTCVSISVDRYSPEVAAPNDKILAFLKQKGATFPNFVLADPKADAGPMTATFGAFQNVPRMVLFDRSGKPVWTNDDFPEGLNTAQRHEHVEKRVRDELAK
jgi:thiol-disulfide isomerase/thioredoxin